MSEQIQHISDDIFETEVLKCPTPVLVDFWAEWCGPCKMAEPVLDELSEAYKDKVVIVKIDVDANPNNSGRLGIMSIPTTVLYKNGTEVGRQVGFAGKQSFEDLIKKALQVQIQEEGDLNGK